VKRGVHPVRDDEEHARQLGLKPQSWTTSITFMALLFKSLYRRSALQASEGPERCAVLLSRKEGDEKKMK